jgi:hypothetical protein
MNSDEGYDGDEGAEIKRDNDRRMDKAKPKEKSAFLAMVLSGVLSLTIATLMFMIGVLWGYKEDARELRGLVQFFAVEVVEIYAETADLAETKLVYYESQEASAPRMVSAVSLGRANSLRVDPSLMATVRSIYGRQSRIRRDLKTFKKGGKYHQMTLVIRECKTLGEEVRRVLKIAGEEGVGQGLLKPLEDVMKEADDRIDSIVKTKQELFPAVWVSKKITGITVRLGQTTTRNFQVKNWSPDEPLKVTRVTSSMPFVTVVMPEDPTVKPLGEITIRFKVTPEGLEPGPFEGTLTVETDRKGFEKLTSAVSGKVYPPRRR